MGKRSESYPLSVTDQGYFAPVDDVTRKRLRSHGLRVGDEVLATISRVRDPRFHRTAHQFGALIQQNIPGFEHLDAHAVLKRLQIESGAMCDEMLVPAGAVWSQMSEHIVADVPELEKALQIVGTLLDGVRVPVRVPRSLSFGSMDETAFRKLMRDLALYVHDRYWPSEAPEAIEQMADRLAQEVA